jgi:hypothetical protein
VKALSVQRVFKAFWRQKTENRDWTEGQWLQSARENMDDAIKDLIDSTIQQQILEAEIVVRSPQIDDSDIVEWLEYIRIKNGKMERHQRFGSFSDSGLLQRLTNLYSRLMGGTNFDDIVF